MLLPHHWEAGQNHDIHTANTALKNVARLKYLRTTVTNQSIIKTPWF
jgi:hypothetical protein